MVNEEACDDWGSESGGKMFVEGEVDSLVELELVYMTLMSEFDIAEV